MPRDPSDRPSTNSLPVASPPSSGGVRGRAALHRGVGRVPVPKRPVLAERRRCTGSNCSRRKWQRPVCSRRCAGATPSEAGSSSRLKTRYGGGSILRGPPRIWESSSPEAAWKSSTEWFVGVGSCSAAATICPSLLKRHPAHLSAVPAGQSLRGEAGQSGWTVPQGHGHGAGSQVAGQRLVGGRVHVQGRHQLAVGPADSLGPVRLVQHHPQPGRVHDASAAAVANIVPGIASAAAVHEVQTEFVLLQAL
mmetsp:Transcript_13865/g.18795  ORF Transcript_13865/g.18795 Transcript_13865/m.18795 type:complete len:250 (-) Transcript_13865:145-894(-)